MTPMLESSTERSLARLAVLADPVRRRVYLHVLRSPEPVSRDTAASSLGIGRPLAAFHLDRLVLAGLLEADYRRLSGRSGPGAGRPAKVYRVSRQEIGATLPPRRYDVLADLFASALDRDDSVPEALAMAAREHGNVLGAEARRHTAHHGGTKAIGKPMEGIVEVLGEAGYGPVLERDGELRLANCPFSAVAERHRSLTCGVNLALIQAMLAEAGVPPTAARLDIRPDVCCVAIQPGD
jgi:predicted ArsR family transcriptional regulator